MIILVDSTKLVASGQEDPVATMTTYDAAVESLVSAVQRSRGRGSARRFHPIFIFSKFDSVHKEALRRAELDSAPPAIRETTRRAGEAPALLDPELKKSLTRITPGAGSGGR